MDLQLSKFAKLYFLIKFNLLIKFAILLRQYILSNGQFAE